MAETRLLVPLDGSTASDSALQKAVAVARQEKDAVVDLLHVIDTRQYNLGLMQGGDVDGRVLYNVEQRAEQELNDLAKPLQDEGLNVRVHLRFGSPRAVIAMDAPTDYASTLIMLGRSTKKVMARLFLGSVASFVLENAPCDVLIVAEPTGRKK